MDQESRDRLSRMEVKVDLIYDLLVPKLKALDGRVWGLLLLVTTIVVGILGKVIFL